MPHVANTKAHDPGELPRMLSYGEVQQMTGLSKWKIWKLVSEGKFPPPVDLGHRTRVWAEPALRAWNDRVSSDGQPPGAP